ncbi:ubiquitin carboxyl-terminal hydrolase 19-like [Phalaenopsis equestris]|uniref:ubiquitin carboxyl-terminal hydrolase 19-like n=1 Tax=Phalaenopsis equestris TaxID=78828 RepID=UPI0009E4DB33|nr:ubiquitin carboxyl-terminal hydrolase 19-like [Phalaenopsis equestris]
MPYQWISGWSGAALVAFAAFSPVVAMVIRKKWRLAEVRRREVMRLAQLAAAEAERAEKEAEAAFYAAEKPVSGVDGAGVGMQNCAVCHSPTTTRCSRCKAVKYCSGTCQITHWRQGHKYECHPPPIADHLKGQPVVSNLKGMQNERPEISENGLGIEKGHDSNDGVSNAQSVSISVSAQSEPSALVFSRPDIEVKPNDTKILETYSTIAVSSESNISSKMNCENGEDGEKHSMSTSKIDINADHLNLSSFSHASTTAGTLSHASFSSDLQPHLMHVNDETEFKLRAPSNMNSANPANSADARISGKIEEFRPMCSGSIDQEKSKTFKFSENCHQGQGETLDLTAAETITCADSTESQSRHNIVHLQLDSGIHFELDLKLSSSKSCSAPPDQGRSDSREPVSLVTGNSGEAAKESSNEQLKSSSPIHNKDHLTSVYHSKTFLGNGSPKVENIAPVSDQLLKIDGSLPNGKVSSRKSVQLSTPSSSPSRRTQSGLSNHEHGKYNKMLFPYDNFIRLYNSDKVEMRPCGLVNCGNSCYANAVLQCLAFTRPLAAFILEGFHAKACLKIGWCFTCEFESLLIKIKQGKSSVSPNGIISHIHDIGSNFGYGSEEDAHEFLRYSIDALQSACLKEAGTNIVGELAEETTLIKLIFGGYLRSKIKCLRCQGKSERRERMMDLTIDIHGDIMTLEEALTHFTASEVLDGDNKYKCGRCQSFERAKKQLTILEAPNVLTIALKRYQSGKYGKLDRMVWFSEYLNLAPYMRGSDDNSPVYRLYAVVVHSGQANATFSGHYVCYVKDTRGMWFKADDSVVKQVDLKKVLSQPAYMLFYARCSPRAPSLLRKEMAKKNKPKEPENKIKHNNTGRRTDDLLDEGFRRPHRVDSLSDISSLFSHSDEGSNWSTESTKDSAASDDCTDSTLSESGHTNSPRRVSVSSDVSSLDLKVDGEGKNGGECGGYLGREGLQFLYNIKHYRNLTEQVSSRGNSELVSSSEAKSNVLFRRTVGDRTAQAFY